MHVANPKDLETNARLVVEKASGFTLGVGSVSITSSPAGAKVWLDGSYKGLTPLTLREIPVGSHVVTLMKQGYIKTKKEFTVSKDKKTELNVSLSSEVVYKPVEPKDVAPPVFPSEGPAVDIKEAFVPRSGSNYLFRVSVSNVEEVTSIKDYYKPRTGYKFVIVYLSQQNVSNEVQIYSGQFALVDQFNVSYEYLDTLSNFWLVVLNPGGLNFGYMVFEIPENAKPIALVLHGLNMPPLSVTLKPEFSL